MYKYICTMHVSISFIYNVLLYIIRYNNTDIRSTLVLLVHKNDVVFQFNSRKLAFVTGFKDISRNISKKSFMFNGSNAECKLQ